MIQLQKGWSGYFVLVGWLDFQIVPGYSQFLAGFVWFYGENSSTFPEKHLYTRLGIGVQAEIGMCSAVIREGRSQRENRRPSLWLRFAAYAILFALLPALAVSVTGCENVQGFSQQSMVRFMDASYNAPAVDVMVAGTLIAGNVGQGSTSNYALVPPNTAAKISITVSGTTTPLFSSYGTLLAGHEHTVLLSDYNSTYQIQVLEDQSTPAASGHSAFRFLNQAPESGPVDIYLLPTGVTFAEAKAIYTALPVGQTTGYISVASQTLSLVIVPTGTTTAMYQSTTAMVLTGGEVKTVLIVDSQLTINPPINVYIANDIPAD